MMVSPYQPLDSKAEQIRMAVLAPGKSDDVIDILLRVESLPKDSVKELQFEAISYVWGNEQFPHTIQINGNTMPIGLILDHALHQSRCLDKERVFWVDALCINQADTFERNSQVQLMGRIYSSATTVLIWLGCGDEDEVKAMQMITSREHWNLEMRQILTRIFEGPWFRRVWVVQELVLARNDPLVYVGPASISYLTLWTQIYGSRRHHFGLAPESLAEEPQDVNYKRFLRATRPFSKLSSMRDDRTCSFAANILNTSQLKATDPRNKVFGILGFSYFPTYP
ncbi:hypothetical protein HBI38_218940 [Parastagonospora nodorum]|nr:hypothetical protein HBI10_235210 [Parastagonospora nodorum]KAH4008881.1 hypothetical protein HBI13_227640 [Parastagonospora nodorum]KAH4903045.1 hypothetical protein HBH74_181820 [Parastagonospora nodorum]KAH4945585.1 hypothetical protein HBH73_143960 [Parastagonospora nodorum]KAH4954754.1 hypothetical protein HBI78_221000 [Parastagonospora nodorum]